jgi:hypothetical protein
MATYKNYWFRFQTKNELKNIMRQYSTFNKILPLTQAHAVAKLGAQLPASELPSEGR